VQQLGNATGVAVIGALYFGQQATHCDRFALVASLVLLAVAIGFAAVLLIAFDHPQHHDCGPVRRGRFWRMIFGACHGW
jgi:hypothetical protein